MPRTHRRYIHEPMNEVIDQLNVIIRGLVIILSDTLFLSRSLKSHPGDVIMSYPTYSHSG